MKISISKSILDNILSSSQPFIEKKDESQITSHVLLIAKDGMLTVKATDFEIGLVSSTDLVSISENGLATANGKKIVDIVKRLKDENIEIETIDDDLILKQGRTKFKLPMFEAEQFPQFPSIEDKPKVDINIIELIKAIKKVAPCIDTTNPKQELNGAYLDILEDNINLVATDTRRLAVVNMKKESDSIFSLIIPKKAILEIQKLFFDESELFFDNVNLIIKSKNQTFFTKLINGKYPDYQKIIPKSLKYSFLLPRDRFIAEIKLINAISNELKITFSRESIIFENLNEENSEAKSEMEYNLEIDRELEIAVNSRYLLDYLQQCETKEFVIGINESNLPFVLSSKNYKTVVMPIIL